MAVGKTLYLILVLAISYNFSNCGNIERWNYDIIYDRCTNNSITPVSCQDVDTPDDLLPHPDDCQLFYYCVTPDHPPVCRQCPAGLNFNPNLHICDHPNAAGCNISSPETPTSRCDKNSSTPVSCEDVDMVYKLLPHPDDCQLFYHCAEDTPVCRQCPSQLHFNPELLVCDYPERAGCSAPNQ